MPEFDLICLMFASLYQVQLFSQTLAYILLWKYFVDVINIYNWLTWVKEITLDIVSGPPPISWRLLEQTLELPRRKGILPQHCNLGILLDFPFCQPVPQNSNSRSRLQVFRNLPTSLLYGLWTCQPSQTCEPFFLSQSFSLFVFLEKSDWYRPQTIF